MSVARSRLPVNKDFARPVNRSWGQRLLIPSLPPLNMGCTPANSLHLLFANFNDLDKFIYGTQWVVEGDKYPKMLTALALIDSGGTEDKLLGMTRTMQVYEWTIPRQAVVKAMKGASRPGDSLYWAMKNPVPKSNEDKKSKHIREELRAYLFDSHYPLMTWHENVLPLEGASVDPEARSVIEQEERQRLVDFALQLHLVVNGVININNVLEWRRYVEEKIGLFSRYPDALKGLAEPHALELERNLSQLLEARQLSGGTRVEATARVLRDRVGRILWFGLSPEELVELQKVGIRPRPPDEGSSLNLMLGHLARYMELAQDVIEAARRRPFLGAAKLKQWVGTFGGALGADLDVFSRMLVVWDAEAIARAVDEAGDLFVEQLLEAYPAAAYFLARPGRLLDALGLSESSNVQTLAPALSRLPALSSGNFAIDLPVLEEACSRIVALGRKDPALVMKALADAHYPLGWLLGHEPEATLEMLDNDLAAATYLVAAQNGCYASPGATLHRIAYHNPDLAAQITVELWQSGHESLVSEALAHFAFDSYWLERLPDSRRSPKTLALFIARLAQARGWPSVKERVRDSMSRYAALAESGDYDPCFLLAFAQSLEEAAKVASPSETAEALGSLSAEAKYRSRRAGLCSIP